MNESSIRNIFIKKPESFVRYTMAHCFSGIFPIYVVNEYPKSGGTWIGQMVSQALNLPFQNTCFPKLQSSVIHGHYLKPWGMKNVIVVWRDGRDIMVSWYYHCLLKNEYNSTSFIKRVSNELKIDNPENIYDNLPKFIEYSFSGKLYPRYSWVDFFNTWFYKSDVIHIRYEDMRKNAVDELINIYHQLTDSSLNIYQANEIVDMFSFSRQSARKPGEEKKNSFLRKGIIGDWRNNFSRESREVFDHYAGDILIKLNYEKSHVWVNADIVL